MKLFQAFSETQRNKLIVDPLPIDDISPVIVDLDPARHHGRLRSTRPTIQMPQRAEIHLSMRLRTR